VKKLFRSLLVVVLLGLAGCQSAPTPTAPAPTLPPAPTSASVTGPTAAAVSPTAEPTAAPTDAPDPTQGAVETVQAYFAALEKGDYHTAGGLISIFSLLVDGLSPTDGTAELQAAMAGGEAWSGLKVSGAEALDGKTVLVQVSYSHTIKDAASGKPATQVMDEVWPVRQEAGGWRYNRGNLVDYHTLDVAAQTTAGLTIQPQQLLRYSDHLRMVFLAQNSTNEPISLGQPSEVEAAFYFNGKAVEMERKWLVFDRLRSYPQAEIELAGWYSSYPEKVEIRRWKNYTTPPWFTFDLG
jgi:hypothetical protein